MRLGFYIALLIAAILPASAQTNLLLLGIGGATPITPTNCIEYLSGGNCIIYLAGSMHPILVDDTLETTFYMSTTGSDDNPGTQESPWASPKHNLRCGEVIIAATGTYSSANFGVGGNWGTVSSCPSTRGVHFATVICAVAFSCIINDTAKNAVLIDQSNWAFIGWSLSSTAGNCMLAMPRRSANIHHIAFINNVANGCQQGVATVPYFRDRHFGVDYFAAVGVITYNAALATSVCTSGISIYEPVNYDTVPGTHIFIAGAFSFANIDPSNCNRGANTDGEGITFDDWSHSQSRGIPYTGQGVIEQSLVAGNGSAGISIFNNTAGIAYITSTTVWNDFQSSTQTGGGGEIIFNQSTSVTLAIGNLVQGTVTSRANIYGCFVNAGNASNGISGNYCNGPSGQNADAVSSPGFTFGFNATTPPPFANPSTPGVPSCSGFATVTGCMETVINNFSNSTGIGYQSPGPCTANDALFPTWLKGIIPAGIITKPCGM
jgi:hypothetical protein